MSSWATTEIGGEPVSAWEYRTQFLSDGEKHNVFHCPFCDVQLAAYLIYTEGELSKSPHFSARWEEHRFGCDGEPVIVDDPERKPPKAHYKPRLMHLPEELIGRPPVRVNRPDTPRQTIVPPTSIEDVSAKRKAAGSLGKSVPRTYLLQPIVEALNITLKEIFDLAQEKKWDGAKRNAEIKKALVALPLRLEDMTNYEDAFRGPAFLNWVSPRIYHGSGVVTIAESGLILISSKVEGKSKTGSMPFMVVIDSTVVAGKAPKSHTALMVQSKAIAAAKKEIRWYAYGKPEQHQDAIVVSIQNLDHLYFKNVFRKQ